VPLETSEIDGHTACELDPNDVDEAVRGRRTAGSDARDVGRLTDDTFGEQESRGEFLVAARRAHRDGDALLGTRAVGAREAETYFERLLDSDRIVDGVAATASFSDLAYACAVDLADVAAAE
jgi:hypothetical protein